MSNETKQTAVEQFAIALYEGGYLQGNGNEINDLLEHHKAIHNQEISNAYIMGKYEHDKIVMSDKFYAKQYYKETYGGNK
jgi:hypothetical protein